MDVITPDDEEAVFITTKKNSPLTNIEPLNGDNYYDTTNEGTDNIYEYEDTCHLNPDITTGTGTGTGTTATSTSANTAQHARSPVASSVANDTNEFLHHSDGAGGGSHSSRSDMINQQSESIKTSRRRMNVIATTGSHGNHDNNHHHHHHNNNKSTTIVYRPTQRLILYSPPRQRQKWGETQILPRVNWFDLFFDLFYVGATYNVSSILYDSPNGKGLLYAAGTFLPVMNIWMDRTYYEGRYVMDDDLVHRLLLIFAFTVVGLAIANIRTVDILSDATHQSNIFFFTMMLVIERIFGSFLYIEVYFYGVGQPQMKHASKRDCTYPSIALPFYIAAMIIAAMKYFHSDQSEGTTGSSSSSHRFMADAAEYDLSSDGMTDIPIILCLIGCTVKLLIYATMIIFCLPKDGRHKETAVPLNVDFVIHRNGEWIMLMLGESIFSLLIVDVQDKTRDFYLVFYLSLLTVILLQLLHFQSQPHDAHLHAVRRSKNRGMLWSLLQGVYSLALVIMGASYTFFLLYANDSVDESRRLASVSGAGEANRLGAAHLYSGALAIVFLSLMIMSLLHESSELMQLQLAASSAAIFRIGIIIVAATISQWTQKPKLITMTGLICVIVHLLLRSIESFKAKSHESTIAKSTKEGDEQKDEAVEILNDVSEEVEASWPNVMHAAAHDERE